MVSLQDTVAVPEFVTPVGEIAPQVRPLGTVSVRDTGPVNLLTAVTAIVEVSEPPTVVNAGVDAAIVKSVIWKSAVAE